MKNEITSLPKEKQEELRKIVEIIRRGEPKVEMIILFGSYARGDWVNDLYVEDKIVYEYESDFDIIILVKSEKLEKDFAIWNKIEEQIELDKSIKTPISLMVDTIEFINEQIAVRSYFYTDIRREGIVLYDSGKYELEESRSLSGERRREMIVRDHDIWFNEKTEESFTDFYSNLERGSYKKAAFELHQAVEALYTTVLLVFTGYKPKTHDLKKLRRRVSQIDSRLKNIFKNQVDEDKRLFNLLRRAYVDARYKPSYTITKGELTVLKEQAEELRQIVKKMCQEKIGSV